MSSLIDEIINKKDEFIKENGKSPSLLIISREQYYTIFDSQEYYHVIGRVHSNARPNTICGIVFAVEENLTEMTVQ